MRFIAQGRKTGRLGKFLRTFGTKAVKPTPALGALVPGPVSRVKNRVVRCTGLDQLDRFEPMLQRGDTNPVGVTTGHTNSGPDNRKSQMAFPPKC
jgi:hypothetical protein